MIRIAEHPVSVMYSRICEDSWKKFDYKINFFDAVTPKDLVYRNELTFKKDRYSDTEKAVWYSHYDLWVECAKRHETMIVLEHDSFLHKKIDDLKNHKFKFLSFINRDFGNNKGRYLAPGSGYFVRPEVARALVDRAKNNTIQQQLDGFINDGLLVPNELGFEITDQGKYFMRPIAATFDSYLNPKLQHNSDQVLPFSRTV